MSLWLWFKHFTHHTEFLRYFKEAEMTLSEVYFGSSWTAEKKTPKKSTDIHGEKFLDLRFEHANKSPVSSLTVALVVSAFTCDMLVVCGVCVHVCVPVPTASM